MTITPMRPWLVAILAAFALFTITAPFAAAAPEGDDGFYLDTLDGLPIFEQHSKQVLLQEGHKVCSAIQHGASEDSATDIVQSDLGASHYEAYRLVAAVELGLDCFSLKTHGM
jgi:hypothetical protein